jgi:multidrug efflux pump subunit AcrA (membrane-fusion protein)
MVVVAALALTVEPPAHAQFGGPAPVRYTEAIQHPIRRAVELTGSVESRRASLVASEVAGVVVELSAREGDVVKKGQPLVRLRQQTTLLRLRAAEGELEEARARLKLAEASRRRAQELFDDEVISVQQLDDAVSEYEARQGRVTQLEADVARLQDQLDRTTVRAPFSGIMVREHTAVGQWIDSGGAVAQLVDIQNLEVGLEFDALDGLEVEGQVRAVIPSADEQARTFPVKVEIANEGGRIGVGMLARTRVPVGEPQPATAVPKDAVVSQGSQRMVFVIDGENKAQIRAVEIGGAAGDWIAVLGGVQPGDRVITRGNERLGPGQEVVGEPIEYERP